MQCNIKEFDINYTSIPSYDMMIRKGKKTNRYKDNQFDIKCISPEEYLSEVAKFHGTTPEHEKLSIWKEKVDAYKKKTTDGSPMPLPLLDYNYRVAEGRHRAMVAIELGLDKIPVLVVVKYKK